MSRDVDFRNDFNSLGGGIGNEVTVFLLGVRAVACGQLGEIAAFHAECGLSLVPIVIVMILEAVVIQMDMEGVHLVI